MVSPLVLVSGLLTTPAIWDLILPLFPTPPLCFAPTEKQTMKQQALDLHRYLLKLGITDCHLIGHSMGGAIALEYTLLYGSHVKSLTLCNSFAKLERKEKCLATLNLIASWLHIPRKWMIHQTTPLLFAGNASDYAKHLYETLALEVSEQAFQKQIKACLAFNREDDLSEIKVPTKIIMSQTDKLLSTQHSQKMHQKIAQSVLTVIEKGGHNLPLENPQELIKAILNP